MNRRQQQAPPRPQPQRQQARVPPPQAQQPPAQSYQYNPNASKQLPPQVTVPQAISILVARINQLEDKCASPAPPVEVPAVNAKQMEDMAARIVKLEMDLLSAKDHIMKLQSFTLSVAKPLAPPPMDSDIQL